MVLQEIYGKDHTTSINIGNANDDEEEIREEDVHHVQVNVDDDEGLEDIAEYSEHQPTTQRRRSIDRNANKVMISIEQNFAAMAASLAEMAPKFDSLINVLSNDRELADLQAVLKTELSNMEGMTKRQIFRTTKLLAKDHDLLRVFFFFFFYD